MPRFSGINSSGARVGTVQPFTSGSSIPYGFLDCDGSAISRTVYATLFAIMGTAYGSGDGVHTFNLPDLRGQFLRGWNNGSGTDPDAGTRTAPHGGAAGDAVGSYQSHQFYTHTHTYNTIPPGNNNFSRVGGGSDVNADPTAYSTTSSGGNETRPVNVYVRYIIAYV